MRHDLHGGRDDVNIIGSRFDNNGMRSRKGGLVWAKVKMDEIPEKFFDKRIEINYSRVDSGRRSGLVSSFLIKRTRS